MRRSVARPLVLLLAALLVAGTAPVASALDVAPTLVSPADGATVAADAPLAWTPVEGATGYRVQRAEEPTFTYGLTTTDTVATTLEPDMYFLPGLVYWRVAALDGASVGPWAEASFTVDRTDIPTPTSPADGTNFVYPGPAPVLSWESSLYGPYDVEIDGPWGLGQYMSFTTRFAVPQVLPPGTWTWRVRPQGHNEGMPWSPSRTFTVTWPDAAPTIVGPANGASTELPILDWDPIPGMATYDIQVSPSADFAQCCRSDFTTDVTTLRLSRQDQEEARWWRVRGRIGSLTGPWSAGRSVNVTPWSAQPADLWPSGGTLTALPTLRWSPIQEASQYDIQVADAPAELGVDSPACRVYVNAASFFTSPSGACVGLSTPAAGDVYWRVRAITPGSPPIAGPWSEVGHFVFDPAAPGAPLASPVVVAPIGPADCADPLTCSTETEFPILQWQPVAGAAFYRVQLDVRDSHLPGRTWDTPATTFIPPLDAFSGTEVARYSWQVVACASEVSCPDWVTPTVDLRHFAILPPPISASPGTGGTYSGEVFLHASSPLPTAPVAGSPWDVVQRPGITIEVDDEPTFSAPGFTPQGVDSTTVVLGTLPGGPIYWRARSSSHPSVGTETRQFTYTFESTVVGPPDGTIVDPPGAISWVPVQGAARYVVELEGGSPTPHLYDIDAPWTSTLVGTDVIPGPLTWKVTPFDASGDAGTPVGGSVIVDSRDPVLFTPAAGASGSAIGTRFSWSPIDATNGYRITVSRTPDFSDIVEETWSQRTSYVPLIEYPAGTLYWRIRPESGYGQTLGEVIGSSETRQFISVATGPDTTSPKATVPTSKPRAATNLSSGRITTRIAWTGSDVGSGVARYELAQRTDSGAWTTVSTNLTSPTLDRPLAPGHTYAFRVRAVDGANLTSAWATGATFRLTGYSELSSAAKYTGTWSSTASTAYWGGKAKSSTRAGAKAIFTFTGRTLAVVSRLGPGRGKAEIWIGSTKMATIDLYSASYSSQRVIWSGAWTTSAKRTVTVKVLGTSGRPRVEVDGFVVGS
jgi:hypothetical protein